MLDSVKSIPGLLIVGTTLFLACKSSSEAVPTDKVSLGVRQSARLSSDAVVRADSIQDSRCPANATCVWAGQANVKLLLSKDTDSSTVRLTIQPGVTATNPKRLDSTNVLLGTQSYKVILLDVVPYPGLDNPGQAKTAVVQVTKL